MLARYENSSWNKNIQTPPCDYGFFTYYPHLFNKVFGWSLRIMPVKMYENSSGKVLTY